jgi:tetratricopeptide (TPR) repeat protein
MKTGIFRLPLRPPPVHRNLSSWLGSAWVLTFLAMGFLTLVTLPLRAGTDLAAGFDAANRLYEEGKFTEAAAAYQSLIDEGHAASSVYFNLGNAWFKAGQRGRALAAYRMAERLDPRDPSLRFNLQFVRKQVTGNQTVPGSFWRRWLESLTLNEWTLIFVCAYWLWFALLALREVRSEWGQSLRGYTATVGVATLLLGVCLAGAVEQSRGQTNAIVIVQEAVVRYGPLDESHVYYQLRDGSEVTVLDEKMGETSWLRIQDATGRKGWLKRSDVIILLPSASKAKTL